MPDAIWGRAGTWFESSADPTGLRRNDEGPEPARHLVSPPMPGFTRSRVEEMLGADAYAHSLGVELVSVTDAEIVIEIGRAHV